MIARLACSRDFQAFRESSDSGQWPREMESGERKKRKGSGKEEGRVCSLLTPTLPPLFFRAHFSLPLPHNLKARNRLSFA